MRSRFRQILGIRFFIGSTPEAVSLGMRGGLVVSPSVLEVLRLEDDPVHCTAVRSSALALAGSGLMVLTWQLLTGERAARTSRSRYLNLLMMQPALRTPGAVFLVSPSNSAMQHHLAILREQGLSLALDDCYAVQDSCDTANRTIADPRLTALLSQRRPNHIIMTLGGGMQEKLGAALLASLDYRPAIHCVGSALCRRSRSRNAAPARMNSFHLSWLLPPLAELSQLPRRIWESAKMISLMIHYHGRLPDGIAPKTAADTLKAVETSSMTPSGVGS